MSVSSPICSAAAPTAFTSRSPAATRVSALRWHEWAALAVGVNEVCLQIDSYFMYHLADAKLGAVGGFNVSVFSVCLAYLYAAWIARTMVTRVERKTKLMWNPPMVVYIAIVALSIVSASVPMLAVFDVFLLVQAFAIFLYLANRIETVGDVVRCVWILASAMCVQAVIVIGLKAFATPGELNYFGPLALTVWPDGRPGGTMHSPVLSGSAMAIMWVPVLALTLSVRRTAWVWLGLACTSLGMMGILTTQTRGAIITAVFGAMVIGWMLARRFWLPKWSLLAALAFFLMAAYPLAMVIVNRVAHGDEGSASARKHLGIIAIDTIKEAPWMGHGAGNCHIACEKAASTSSFRSEWYFTVHCKYLLVWLETGIFGLIAFMSILGNAMRHGMSAWTNRASPVLAILGLGFTAAILGHMTHLLVDVFNSRTQVQLLWIMLGITAAIYRVSRQSLASQRHGGRAYGL